MDADKIFDVENILQFIRDNTYKIMGFQDTTDTFKTKVLHFAGQFQSESTSQKLIREIYDTLLMTPAISMDKSSAYLSELENKILAIHKSGKSRNKYSTHQLRELSALCDIYTNFKELNIENYTIKKAELTLAYIRSRLNEFAYHGHENIFHKKTSGHILVESLCTFLENTLAQNNQTMRFNQSYAFRIQKSFFIFLVTLSAPHPPLSRRPLPRFAGRGERRSTQIVSSI